MTRDLPFVTAILLFVYAGDMVWLFASNQAHEPNAALWWAEALASVFFPCLGLAATVGAGAKLWKERNVAVLPREDTPPL